MKSRRSHSRVLPVGGTEPGAQMHLVRLLPLSDAAVISKQGGVDRFRRRKVGEGVEHLDDGEWIP